MEKSKNSKDLNEKQVYQIVSQELKNFAKLIKGHEKILSAIAQL